MKKIVLISLVLILATLCFASCQPTDYDKLNQISEKNYSYVQIDITVQKSGESSKLQSKVICLFANGTTKRVAYDLQEYATFGTSGDTITLPSQQIVTKTGSVEVTNDSVTNQEGDQVDMDFVNVGQINFYFDDLYLANAKTENGVFTADVTNLVGLCGRNVTGATNAKVSVDVQTYSSITISYTANGSDVTIVYTLA